MGNKQSQVITLGMFDIMKGLGLIVVLLVHTFDWFNVTFYPIRVLYLVLGNGLMPFFFLVSGFGLKKRRPLSFLKKSAKELVIPCVVTMVAMLLVSPVSFRIGIKDWKEILALYKKLFYACLLGSSAERVSMGISFLTIGPIWYLLALFWGTNLINLVLHLPQHWQSVSVIVLVAASLLFERIGIWYYCLPAGLLSCGFLYLGYIAKKQRWLQKQAPWLIWLLSLLACVCSLFIPNIYLSMYNVAVSNLIPQYIIAGGTGVFILLCGLWLNRFNILPFNLLRRLGRYSLWGLCVHNFEQFGIPIILLRQVPLLIRHPHMGFFLAMVLRFIVMIAGCALIAHISKWFRSYKRRMVKQKKGATAV